MFKTNAYVSITNTSPVTPISCNAYNYPAIYSILLLIHNPCAIEFNNTFLHCYFFSGNMFNIDCSLALQIPRSVIKPVISLRRCYIKTIIDCRTIEWTLAKLFLFHSRINPLYISPHQNFFLLSLFPAIHF